jgi:hypothetical protein
MGKRIPGKSVTLADITASAAPTGLDGIDMTLFAGRLKPRWWLVTLEISGITDDISIWGSKAVSDDPADDVWGLHQDELAAFPLGLVGTLPPGRYQFMCDGLGLYSRVSLTTTGATAKASLDLGTLGTGALDTVIQAQVAGAAGESITVQLIGDSGAGVTLDETGAPAIVIHYQSQISTVANVETAIGGSTLIEVKTAGTAGKILDATDDQFAATHLASGAAAVKASLDLITKTTHCDTVIQAKVAGTGGNAFRIAFVADGAGAGSLTLAGSDYTFHYATGVTTVANFETLITASANLEVKTPGTGATLLVVVVDAFALTNLAGGLAAVKSELNLGTLADGQLDTVVRAKTGGTAGDAITVALVGDAVAGVTISEVGNAVTIHFHDHVSTVANVETAITASSALIEIKTPGTAAKVLDVEGESFAATNLLSNGTTHVDLTLTEILDAGRGN